MDPHVPGYQIVINIPTSCAPPALIGFSITYSMEAFKMHCFMYTLNPFISLKDGAIVFVLCDRSRIRCKQISLVNVRTSTEGFSSQEDTSSFLQNREREIKGQMFVWDTQSFLYQNFLSDQQP